MEQEEPSSIDEARKEYAEAVDMLQNIQQQLGERNRCNVDGTRMNSKDFWSWRSAARAKLRRIEGRVRFLKDYFRRNAQSNNDDKAELKSAIESHAVHFEECEWWESSTCSCGLGAVMSKYSIPQRPKEDFE